jgi:streptogramin lyase
MRSRASVTFRVFLVSAIVIAFLLSASPAHSTLTVTEYDATSVGTMIWSITSGPDGALWFTAEGGSNVGRITTSGQVTSFTISATPAGGTCGITAGPDGAMWFTTAGWNRVGRVTTSGTATLYPASPANMMGGIAVGSDNALWYVESGANQIGRITTAGVMSHYGGITPNAILWDIVAGPDGALWFTELGADRIGRITTVGAVTEFALPAGSGPRGLARGPDNTIWFTETKSGKIGRITTAGVISEFTLPTGSAATSITAGSDGALWFAEAGANRIGRITTSGQVSEYGGLTAGSTPEYVTAGPDGAIWFTEYNGNRVGRLGGPPPVPNFDTYIVLLNPNAQAASVTLTYMMQGGGTKQESLSVGPTSRKTVFLNDSVGPNVTMSTRLNSNRPVVAERPMYFNYVGKWTGGHDVVGALAPAKEFYFAEGTCRPCFDSYICIQNPGTSSAAVKITYMKGDATTRTQTLSVAGSSRATVRVKDALGEGNDAAHDFSARVECTNGQTMIAERPMYFDYQGYNQLGWTGGHDVVGALAPAKTFYFAEGTCRPGFDAYLCIQNPGAAAASVKITYMKGDGSTDVQTLSVPKNSRYTLKVKDRMGEGDDAAHDFSARVECTNGQTIIAERPMYFDYQGYNQHGWTGGHDVVGALAPANTFYFAEGYTGQ